MNIKIAQIMDNKPKGDLCESILRKLPDWFGIESAILDYAKEVQEMPMFVAYDKDVPVGFLAVKEHNVFAAEVFVMGILGEYHRKGLGKRLINECERYCLESNKEYLTVKTLDESRENKSYERTRHFYLAMGFKPLEVFKTLWDESNPCLFMVKKIAS